MLCIVEATFPMLSVAPYAIEYGGLLQTVCSCCGKVATTQSKSLYFSLVVGE